MYIMFQYLSNIICCDQKPIMKTKKSSTPRNHIKVYNLLEFLDHRYHVRGDDILNQYHKPIYNVPKKPAFESSSKTKDLIDFFEKIGKKVD